jgi:KUP system potassium uptake protein
LGHSTTKQKVTAATLLIALGIIYGDIGTSPLYVMKAIVQNREINEILIYGGISCVFWTLLFQTTIKYITLTLQADNNGEGGIFSLYALVRRYGSNALVIATILGATTLLADGIITPPISVSSAIEGLTPLFPHIPTLPIVLIILSLLFLFQRFGTHAVGKYFGPIMVVWFSMLFVLGINEAMKYPDIFNAFNPWYAYELLTQYPHGFWLLGAVFLCTTGAEALYSDLGHCGRENIRITWVFVKICLLVNYLGQGAWLLHESGGMLNGRNPFYGIMPEWFLVTGIVIATMAAIIASQALISGSFTLINEAMNLNFWPRVSIRQPSETKGQIYIPSVNVILWIGCMFTVLYFKTSEHMEGAYGFFITLTMIMTTLLLTYFMLYKKKWNRILVLMTSSFFLCIEVSFFIANAIKLKESWTFLFFAFFIFLIMYVWYFARKANNKHLKFVHLDDYIHKMDELSHDDEVPKFSTHLIYLTKANSTNNIEEKIMNSIFSKKPKRADVYWFLHIHRTEEPYTLDYNLVELLNDKVIKVNINVGFRMQPLTEYYFKRIVQDLVDNEELNLHIRPDGSTKYNSEPDFKFVVIEKFISVENEFEFKEGFLINGYYFLKNLGLSDVKAFGLEKSDVVIEDVPFLYHSHSPIELKRINKKS